MLSLELPNHSSNIELEPYQSTALIISPEKQPSIFETINHQLEVDQSFKMVNASLPKVDKDVNVATYIKQDFQQLLQNLRRYEQLSIQLTKIMSPSHLPALMEEMEALEHQIGQYNGWDLDENMGNWLTFLKGPKQDDLLPSLNASDLYKVNLTKSILNRPTLLCLDHPLDHLDENLLLETIEALKHYETKVILTFSNENLPKNLVDHWVEIS